MAQRAPSLAQKGAQAASCRSRKRGGGTEPHRLPHSLEDRPRVCAGGAPAASGSSYLPFLEHACQEGILSRSQRQQIHHQQHAQRVILRIEALGGGDKRNTTPSGQRSEGKLVEGGPAGTLRNSTPPPQGH